MYKITAEGSMYTHVHICVCMYMQAHVPRVLDSHHTQRTEVTHNFVERTHCPSSKRETGGMQRGGGS